MQKVLIIGSEGSMGKRYQAIFNYINQENYQYEVTCFDTKFTNIYPDYDNYNYIIIASPTITHQYFLHVLANYKRPILCEKPVIKDLNKLDNYLSSSMDLQMMFQYAFLAPNKLYKFTENHFHFETNHNCQIFSKYDYFKTSNTSDSLIWDCIQIIALHLGNINNISIKNTSPVWDCMINDHKINLSQMDQAYIEAVSYWLSGKRIDDKILFLAHKKVVDFIENLK